jgi:ATP-dependent exoDNAse (exonuclease V) beta subunit
VADLLSGPQGTDIAGHLRGRYRYLFLDEFQDTDMVQRRIVDAFVGVFHAVLVVGDGKQSIYRFRSADPSLLYEIARDNGVDVLPLNLSRRPTLPLLDVQNALFRSIGGNPNYRELASPLEASEDAATPSDDIPPLTFIQHDRSTRGADVLATIIRDLVSGDFDDSRGGGLRRVEPGDIVVLLRYNWQVQDYLVNLSNTLQADGISVRVEEAGMFFRRPEIVATHRMLRLVLEYPDDTLLSMALRSPYLRSIDPSDEERRLLHYPPRFGHPLTDWFERTDPARRDLLSKLRQAALVDTVPQVIAQLYRDFGIREHYLARADRQAAANLDKLRELARRLFNEEQALTLRQFVNFLQLSIETGQEESDARVQTDHEDSPESRPPYIRLMTVHGAKGLEFPFVLLPDMHLALRNPRHLPTFLLSRTHGFDFALPRTADRPEDVEFTQSPRFQVARNLEMREQIREEMRILYVAVTRAQHAVYMTGANGGRRRNGPNSAFYSWQDEVLPTFPTLAPLGAVLRSG